MPRSTSGPATLTLIAFQLFAYLTPTLASIPGPRGIASNVLGSAASVSKRADGGYTDPAAAGGDMLTVGDRHQCLLRARLIVAVVCEWHIPSWTG